MRALLLPLLLVASIVFGIPMASKVKTVDELRNVAAAYGALASSKCANVRQKTQLLVPEQITHIDAPLQVDISAVVDDIRSGDDEIYCLTQLMKYANVDFARISNAPLTSIQLTTHQWAFLIELYQHILPYEGGKDIAHFVLSISPVELHVNVFQAIAQTLGVKGVLSINELLLRVEKRKHPIQYDIILNWSLNHINDPNFFALLWSTMPTSNRMRLFSKHVLPVLIETTRLDVFYLSAFYLSTTAEYSVHNELYVNGLFLSLLFSDADSGLKLEKFKILAQTYTGRFEDLNRLIIQLCQRNGRLDLLGLFRDRIQKEIDSMGQEVNVDDLFPYMSLYAQVAKFHAMPGSTDAKFTHLLMKTDENRIETLVTHLPPLTDQLATDETLLHYYQALSAFLEQHGRVIDAALLQLLITDVNMDAVLNDFPELNQ